MRRLMTSSLISLLTVLPAAAQELSGIALRSLAAPAKSAGLEAAKVENLSSFLRIEGLATLDSVNETCVIDSIDCNSTVSSVLQASDCDLGDGTVADFWLFSGVAGQQVTIDLLSADFDTFLFLLDPTPEVVATDDDGGGGTNSRIAAFPLDQTGDWAIAVNNFEPVSGDPGAYMLTLTCAGGSGSPPAAPSDLDATALSSTEIELDWQDNSNDETEFRVEIRTGGGSFMDIGSVGADSIGAIVSSLQPATAYDFRVRARNASGNSPYSNQASATTLGGGPIEPCVPSATNLCLNNGRFKVEVQWGDFSTPQGTGPGMVVPFGSDDSGLFWFFNADNWEVLVKILDGCGITDHFWVFSAATTNVEYTLRVTDSDTGISKEYVNELGVSAPAITDTQAFATCP